MIFLENEGNIPPTPYLRTSRCLETVFEEYTPLPEQQDLWLFFYKISVN